MLKIIGLTLVLVIVASTPVFGCIGARNIAMGETGVAFTDDSLSAYWNPSDENINGITISISDFYQYIAFTGGNLSFAYVDDVESQSYFKASLSYKVSDRIKYSIGIEEFNVVDDKIYIQPLLSSSYTVTDNITFGLLIDGFNFRPGFSFKNEFFLLSIEGYDVFNLYNLPELRIGSELKLGFISLRCGYINYFVYNHIAQTYGLGCDIDKISIDFAYIDYQWFSSNDSYISISVRL